MFATAIGLLVVAAISGAVMIAYIFVGSVHPPMPLAIMHGSAAASAVILAVSSAITKGASTALTLSLVVLILALLGGLYLLAFHLQGKSHPRLVIALHALLALGGFVGLALAVLQAASAR